MCGAGALTVPFVACGDLSGLDADKSYPLRLASQPSLAGIAAEFSAPRPHATPTASSGQGEGEHTGNTGIFGDASARDDGEYSFTAPVQLPIHPNYTSFRKIAEAGGL